MIQLKNIFLVLSTFCILNQGISQDSIGHFHYAKYAIGISPSAIVNTYPGIQISQDFRIDKLLNFSLETAYLYYADSVQTPIKGYRIKMGIEKSTKMYDDVALSFGIHGLLRYTREEKFAEFRHRENYIQNYPYDESRRVIGVELTYRMIINLSDRFFVEFGNGIGYGKINVIRHGYYPRSNTMQEIEINWYNKYDEPGLHDFYIISTNFNISYRLVY